MMQKPDIKNRNVGQEKYTILQRQSLNYNNEINSKKNVASNKKNNGIFKKIVYNFSDFFKNNLKRKKRSTAFSGAAFPPSAGTSARRRCCRW